MKWVLWGVATLCAIVVVIAGSWFIIGGRTLEHERTVVINAPAKQVFASLTDPALQRRWMSGIKEVVPLTEGGTKVGARSRIVVEENGRTMEMTDEVLEFTPDQLLVVRIEGEVFTVTNRFELTAQKQTTTLKQSLSVGFHGSARFAAPFVGSSIKQKMDADLDTLQRAMEQQRETERLLRTKRNR